METSSSSPSFLARNEFLIRRLHSLSGLIPVGAYMVVHLLTNSSILASPQRFQSLVYQIHALGPALPVVEWLFIFLPLIFHAVIGVMIVRGGLPNTTTYSYSSNIRYSLQRASGMIAFVFIFWHVFHMHGWFHADWWVNSVAKPLRGANFFPFSAASSAALALKNPLVVIFYAVGVLSCVFHLANGLWTMGITWGLWISPAAQKRANVVAIAFGAGLAAVSMGALTGFSTMDDAAVDEARRVERIMFDQRVETGEVSADSHKFGQTHDAHDHDAAAEQPGASASRQPRPESGDLGVAEPVTALPVARLK